MMPALISYLYPVAKKYEFNEGKVTEIKSGLAEQIKHYIAIPFTFIAIFFATIASTIWSFSPFREEDHKEPKPLPEATIHNAAQTLPPFRGFSTSTFQSSGISTYIGQPKVLGRSNWNDWIRQGKVEGDISRLPIDILSNPDSYIKALQEKGVTAHRFSIERAAIETSSNLYDEQVINLYITFCDKLKAAGIEPWVTLHHFVDPAWFDKDLQRFETKAGVESFVEYCDYIVGRLQGHVKYLMTFNEPGVYVFQTYFRQVYPSLRKVDVALAGEVLKNILVAHMRVYRSLKQKHPELVIGITHQWLKFVPYNQNNFIEKMTCNIISEITHYSVFNFFKDRNFAFHVPFICNVQMKMRDIAPLTDFLGVQAYGFPNLKIGMNGGKEFPGFGVMNLVLSKRLGLGMTFGNTCHEGGIMSSFGPLFHPTDVGEALKEAETLNIPLAITETGCDRRSQKFGATFKDDEEAQAAYIRQIFSLNLKHLQAFFLWTDTGTRNNVGGQIEWERGANVQLGLYIANVSEKVALDKAETYMKRELVHLEDTHAGAFVASVFNKAREGGAATS